MEKKYKMKPVAMKPVSTPTHPTIRDVARKAGVSPGTVSRVLNNSPLVTPLTRSKVLEIVKELDYHPNLMAHRLSIGKTLRIGAIVPFFHRPAEIERLRGVVSALSVTTYDLVIHNVETPDQRDIYFTQIPHRERVDGVIVISLPPKEEDIARLSSAGIPIIFIDVHQPWIQPFDRVTSNDFSGGRLATRYLISLGHEKIGFIGDLPDESFLFTSSHDRYLGYRKALDEAGISLNDTFIAHEKHDRYAAHKIAERMLTMEDRPTAIFAASDTQAMGVIAAARTAGLFVPDNLSIVGYDDIEIAEYLGLTTVRQPLFDSGRIGVELLLERINNPDREPVEYTLQNEFMIRTTTSSPKHLPQ
jgi:LacI family transcriptional regulator